MLRDEITIPPTPSEQRIIESLRATHAAALALQDVARSMERGHDRFVDVTFIAERSGPVRVRLDDFEIFSGLADALEQHTDLALRAFDVSVDPATT